MATSDNEDLLTRCPSVPKFTPIDDFSFNNQYDKCIQMVDMLYNYIVINKNKFVTESNIKIISEQIDKFYEFSECVKKTKQVLHKINCIEQFKKIIGIINSKDGYSALKTFYDSLNTNAVSLSEKLNKLSIK